MCAHCLVSYIKVRLNIGTDVEEVCKLHVGVRWLSYRASSTCIAWRCMYCASFGHVTEMDGKEMYYVKKPKPGNAPKLGILSERRKMLILF